MNSDVDIYFNTTLNINTNIPNTNNRELNVHKNLKLYMYIITRFDGSSCVFNKFISNCNFVIQNYIHIKFHDKTSLYSSKKWGWGQVDAAL